MSLVQAWDFLTLVEANNTLSKFQNNIEATCLAKIWPNFFDVQITYLKDNLSHLENLKLKQKLTWKISQKNSAVQSTITSIALCTTKPTIITTNNIFT